MKWHCDKDGNCHKRCEAARVGSATKVAGEEFYTYPIDCEIMEFRTWVCAENDVPEQNAVCPVNKLLHALSDKIISNIKEHEEYLHDSYVTNKTQISEAKNIKEMT